MSAFFSGMGDALVSDTLDVDGHGQLLKVLEERLVVDQEDLTARIVDDLAGDLDGGSSSDEVRPDGHLCDASVIECRELLGKRGKERRSRVALQALFGLLLLRAARVLVRAVWKPCGPSGDRCGTCP